MYSVTTISGPPLAILFNNQGLVKNEFRAGLALVRVVESSVTAIVYYKLSLFIPESKDILLTFIPSVVVGIPLGAYVIRRMDAETFRRVCMSFDAWVVGFGLSRTLIELNLMQSPWAYGVMVITILIDLCLLYIFFTKRRQTVWAPGDPVRPHIHNDITIQPSSLFGPLGRFLGYVIAAAAVAMLFYYLSPGNRLLP